MNEYISDFSYLDSENIIRRKRDFLVGADEISTAILLIKTEFHVIRIISIRDTNAVINYSKSIEKSINYS